MYISTKASIFGCVLVVASVSGAATINGTFTYDGLAVDSVFSDVTGTSVLAENPADSTSVYGTVNLAAGTFTIEDVTVGQNISVYLTIDRSQPANGTIPDSDDLYDVAHVSIASSGDTVNAVLELMYVVRFTAPVDSTQTMNGFYYQCQVGAEVASPTTVVWSAVPRAETYKISVRRKTCDHILIDEEIVEQTSTSLALTLETQMGEDHAEVWVECTGTGGEHLCYMPFLGLQDALVQAYPLNAGGGSGRGMDHADAYFIPAVASAAGVPPTFWSSEVVIVNPTDVNQIVDLVFTPRNQDGWTVYERVPFKIGANSARSWGDVLDQLFSRDGAGSLEIRGSGLVVSSRTSTPAAGGGSYGLGVPPLAPEDLLTTGANNRAYAGGLQENADWRTNFGVCEVSGRSVTIKISIYDDSMTALGDRSITLGPYENTQINRVVRALTGMDNREDDIIGVEIKAGTGKIGAYLTVIDNTTGDSTYVPIAPQTPTGG